MIVISLGACQLAVGQDALVERLPVSVGANSIITVKPGESWVAIGLRHHVGYEHLRRANGGDIATARRLFIPGRHQATAYVANGLVVNLPELTTFRWQNSKVVAWYPVSIGRVAARWRTPEGHLRVVNRVVNPVWNRPDWAGGGQMPPGPRNPLGDRWIGLNRSGYGLHGTNDPTSIGRYVSHGCLRHYPADIRAIFAETRVGMPVIITYQTVTVGVERGTVYMAVFPDIYARGTNAPRAARARLARFGLDGALSDAEWAARLARTDGIARPILGSTVPVTVNIRRLDSPIGPTLRGGAYYLPARSLANALGAQVAWSAGTVTLTRGKQRVAFTVGRNAFFVLGSAFVPVRRAVQGLGGLVIYAAGGIRIVIV